MPWTLDHKPHKHFARNSLATVVTQLRFHPILKVEAKVADFQDAVRPHFPVFGQQLSRQVNVALEGIEFREEKAFLFSTTTGDLTVSLGIASVALEASRYTHHDEFLAKAASVLAALEAIYRPIASTRLGLRYVNIIKRGDVATHLGRTLEWSDLVTADFLRVPGRVDLGGTRFSSEVTSSMPVGVLTLRHGLLNSPPQGEHFRFDMDRYVEGPVEVAQARTVLEGFSDDLYALFDGMVGPALSEWMEPIDAGDVMAYGDLQVRVTFTQTTSGETPVADPRVGTFATTDPGSAGVRTLPVASLVLNAVTHVQMLGTLPLNAADDKIVEDLVRARVPTPTAKKALPRR